ncbi:MAG: flagellar hook-length control protein FliK [Christensenellales bacterium]
MTNAMTLCGNEAQSIVAAKGSGRAGRAFHSQDRVSQSFKKKLEAFGAMAVPAQQAAPDCGNITLNTGMQDEAEAVQAISAEACTIEGIELPVDPQVTANIQAAFADPTTQAAGTNPTQGVMEDGRQDGAVAGQNAWMQTAVAGENPAITQDQILKTVGDYLDESLGLEGKTSQAQQMNQEAPPEKARGIAPSLGESADIAAQGAFEVEATSEPETAIDGILPKNSALNPQGGFKVAENASGEIANAAKKTDTGREGPEMAEMDEDTAFIQTADGKTDVREPVQTAQETQPSAIWETEEPQYARENILRIVDSVHTKSAEGRHEFEVELKPEFLGKIRIRLTMEKGSIHMQIHTDDPSVKQLLSEHSPSLMGELKEKGISLSGMDVSYDNPTAFDGREQHSGSNGGNRQGGGMHAFVQADSRAEQKWDAFSLYAGNSTVEFFA